MEAGFIRVVEVDSISLPMTLVISHNFLQWLVANTLLRDDPASQLKGWIQGNTKIGPVLEVATSYFQGKHGVEIRIMSLNRDNTHSGVRISHGSTKFVMNLNNKETNSRRSARRICVKTGCKRFCMPMEGTSKTTRKRTCWFFTEKSSH